MIKTKADLKQFLEADRKALGKEGRPRLIGDEVWRFEIALRKHEYYSRQKGILKKMARLFYGYRHHRLGLKLGFDIPISVFGPGLRINHRGLLVVSPLARIGKNCDIHQGVNIGVNKAGEGSAIIGDNCWIGPGVKIFGPILLDDGVAIGANSVVNRTFLYDNVTIAGVPARIVNHHGTSQMKTAKNLVMMR